MKIKNNNYLQEICKEILAESKTMREWCEIESDDMFSKGNIVGGFDATEEEFCFSITIYEKDYWFQFPLSQVKMISVENDLVLIVRCADSY